MGCCGGARVGDASQEDPKVWFYNRRGCTDVCCLAFFGIFMAGMAYITLLSVSVGDPYAVFYGQDYLGNRCGVGEMVTKPKVYYPRVDEDLLKQSAIAATMPWKLRFYGLCLEKCPPVTTPQGCFDNPEKCTVYDYGPVEARTKAGGSAYYYATLPSVDLINRCIPNDKYSLEQEPDRCAFPQCDGDRYAPCDEEYPTTWRLENNFPRAFRCKVRFKKGKIEQLSSTTSGTVAQSLGKHVSNIQAVIDSLVENYTWLLIFGVAMPIVLGFVWLVLLRFFAKTFTYVMIIAIGLLMLLLTFYFFYLAGAVAQLVETLDEKNTELKVSNGKAAVGATYASNGAAKAMGLADSAHTAMATVAPNTLNELETTANSASPTLWWIVGSLSALVTLLYIFSMCMARKKIHIAASLVKEGSMVIKDRPATMFFPFLTLVAQVLVVGYFVLTLLFLGTANLNASHFSGVSSVVATSSYADQLAIYEARMANGEEAGLKAYQELESSETWVQLLVYAYFVFGTLWLLEVLNNISWTTMSGSVSHWFFFRDDDNLLVHGMPLLRSLGRTLLYHVGSIAFGSFIIAVVQFIRLLFTALDYYTKKQQKTNFVIKLAIKCCQCCLWCLEKTLKFITDYCYIYVAMQGTGFCRSCYLTFKLIILHPAQLGINTFVRAVLSWLQLLAVPAICGYICNQFLVAWGEANAMWPTVAVVISAYIIVRAFKTVFACVLDTLFVCCCRDKDQYHGKYMPDRLKVAFGFDKKSKKEARREESKANLMGGGGEGRGDDTQVEELSPEDK